VFYIAALETERTAHQQKDPDIGNNSNMVVVMNLININEAVGSNSRVKVCNSNDDIRWQPPHCGSNLLQDERIASGMQDSKLPKTPVSGHRFLRRQLHKVGSSFQWWSCWLVAVTRSAFQRRSERRFDAKHFTVSLAVLLWAALPVSAAIGRWTQSSLGKTKFLFALLRGFYNAFHKSVKTLHRNGLL
jgi:hypothetical protein